MSRSKTTSTSAKILYRPVGMVSGLVSGALAGVLFKQIWKVASPSDSKDTPKALESEFPMREILIASALQGAIYATVKALVDRGGARAFEKTLGEWPGD